MKNDPSGNGAGPDAPSFIGSISPAERLIYLTIGIVLGVGLLLAQFARDFLENYYLREDGILEWAIVVLLLLLAALCIRRAIRLKGQRPRMFILTLVVIGIGFVFVAGEELSWGQRVFGIETPDWLEEQNQQGELNIHNLRVGDISVNQVVFGHLLILLLAFYMLVLPVLATFLSPIRRLVEYFGLPMPRWYQAAALFPISFLPEFLIDSSERDEMVEVIAILMLLAIFAFPRNGYIYAPDWRVGDPPRPLP